MKANSSNATQSPFSLLPPAALDAAFNAKPFEAFTSLFKIWSNAQAEMMEQTSQASQKWFALLGQMQTEPPKSMRGLMQTMVTAQRRGFEEWRREVRALNDSAARCAYESAECASELLPDQEISPLAILEAAEASKAKAA
jgi:hypothetical protein